MEQNNVLKLFTDGKVKTGDREFTRLIGGFGESKPVISDKQIADLLGYSRGIREVRKRVNDNIKYFEYGVDILDLQRGAEKSTLAETLISLGYAKQSITQASNIYIFSESGFLLYLKFAEGDKAVELYKNFLEDYFKTKAENKVMEHTLQQTLETLDNERRFVLGSMFMESDSAKKMQLFERNEEILKQMTEIEKTLTKEQTAEQFKEIVEISERFTNSNGLYDIGDFAKILDIKGLGRNKLFDWMRKQKILMNDNTPYQKHADHFKVISTTTQNGFVNNKTLLKPQGISYIIKRLIKDNKIADNSYDELMDKVQHLKEIKEAI